MLAVESAPNGLLMLNAAGQIQSANRAVEKLFGYSRDELLGCMVEKLIPERFRVQHTGLRDAFNKGSRAKALAGRDLVGLRKDGVEIPLHIYLNQIDTHTGELILCTIIDIAERIANQQQLELAKKAAEAANRAKSDFLARMCHEIRTPMNLIMGMNALLPEKSAQRRTEGPYRDFGSQRSTTASLNQRHSRFVQGGSRIVDARSVSLRSERDNQRMRRDRVTGHGCERIAI